MIARGLGKRGGGTWRQKRGGGDNGGGGEASDMNGRPGRARHTVGRSGVNRDSRMPLPKSFPSDRRRRHHASLRAEAREYHGILVLLYHHKYDTATALCRWT